MRDENCIFCKIIAGEIPSNTIYEDDEFKVVLDVSLHGNKWKNQSNCKK